MQGQLIPSIPPVSLPWQLAALPHPFIFTLTHDSNFKFIMFQFLVQLMFGRSMKPQQRCRREGKVMEAPKALVVPAPYGRFPGKRQECGDPPAERRGVPGGECACGRCWRRRPVRVWRSGRRLMPHYRGRPRRRCSWPAAPLLPLRQVLGALLLAAAPRHQPLLHVPDM